MNGSTMHFLLNVIKYISSRYQNKYHKNGIPELCNNNAEEWYKHSNIPAKDAEYYEIYKGYTYTMNGDSNH